MSAIFSTGADMGKNWKIIQICMEKTIVKQMTGFLFTDHLLHGIVL